MPDFERNVHCLLGLPIDALTLAEATSKVHDAVVNKRRCFLSTPNLNFLVQSQHTESFRQSIVDSDLSTADGMPIVWFARLMGIPIPERVAGADIFEELLHGQQRPAVKVFILGGPPDAADEARAKINKLDGGVNCVGSGNPGYGSIEDMSRAAQIDAINQSQADFVLVALGAAKGQAWIVRNLERLSAPVLSHLGAVVNFSAGTVKRAPKFAQQIGLEWLWRIKEEPALWRRYWRDGWGMLGLLAKNVLPSIFFRKCMGPRLPLRWKVMAVGTVADTAVLKLYGSVTHENVDPLRAPLAELCRTVKHLTLDFKKVTQIDSSFLGLLLLLQRELVSQGGSVEAKNYSWAVAGYAKSQCVDLNKLSDVA